MSRSRTRSVSRSRSRSRSRTRSRTVSPRRNGDGVKEEGFKVVVVSGLTKNVHKGHLEEIFGVYGRITAIDMPLFKVCKCEKVSTSASRQTRCVLIHGTL